MFNSTVETLSNTTDIIFSFEKTYLTPTNLIITLQEEVNELTKQIKKQSSFSLKYKLKKPDNYNGKTFVQFFFSAVKVYLFQQRKVLCFDKNQVLKIALLLNKNVKEWFKPVFENYTNNTKDDKKEGTNRLFEKYVNFEKNLRFIYGNPDKVRSVT